jgi:hypothetical protein
LDLFGWHLQLLELIMPLWLVLVAAMPVILLVWFLVGGWILRAVAALSSIIGLWMVRSPVCRSIAR